MKSSVTVPYIGDFPQECARNVETQNSGKTRKKGDEVFFRRFQEKWKSGIRGKTRKKGTTHFQEKLEIFNFKMY